MVFVADDLAAWLVALLADAGRRKLTTMALGSDQKRALRHAATAAAQLTARQLRPDDEQAQRLAADICKVFGRQNPIASLAGSATILEGLQAAVSAEFADRYGAGPTDAEDSSGAVLGFRRPW